MVRQHFHHIKKHTQRYAIGMMNSGENSPKSLLNVNKHNCYVKYMNSWQARPYKIPDLSYLVFPGNTCTVFSGIETADVVLLGINLLFVQIWYDYSNAVGYQENTVCW